MDVLFTTYAGDVYRFALRRTSRSAAEDVVSETFLVAWRRLDSIPDAPKPWLLGVARRVLANQRRAAGRQSALTARLRPSDPSRDAVADEPADSAVVQALNELAPVDRDAITLIAWDGLSPEEAAIVLDCSRATFYVRLHRAKKRLAAGLSTTGDHTADQNNEQRVERS